MTKIVLTTKGNVSLTKQIVDIMCAVILQFLGIEIEQVDSYEDGELPNFSKIRESVKNAVIYLQNTTDCSTTDEWEFYISLIMCMKTPAGCSAVEILSKTNLTEEEKEFLRRNKIDEHRLKTIKWAYKKCETLRNQN